jgi:hypothetical protein
MSRRRIVIAGACAAVLGLAGLVEAQQPSPAPAQPAATPIPPPDIVPPDEAAPTPAEAAAASTPQAARPAGPPAAKPEPVAAVTMGGKPVVEPTDVPPPEPEKPLRAPIAVIQALDKVTAETMRFAVPVGRKVRYKNLVFTAKACETKGLDDPQPQSAAYLIIESQPRESVGRAPPVKQVFKGWMYAVSPGLHPLEHPVYDAWLVACSITS